jgi:membrane-associated phospholipid phosphatase
MPDATRTRDGLAPPRRRRLALAALLAAGLLSLAALLGAMAGGFSIRGLGNLAATLGLLGLNLWFYRGRRGGERAADLAAAAAFFTAIATASAVLTYLGFRAGAPLADARLAAWDAALGFDWPVWEARVAARPGLARVLHLAYAAMAPQLALALFALPLAGMTRRSDEFLLVIGLAMPPTLLLCALLPAEGAGVFFGHAEPAHYLAAQRALRDGSLTDLTLGALQGIVTFPSFHTIAAVALINAARGTPLAFLAWVLNLLMIVSTPTEGWHYLVDVLAGVAIALAAIALARRMLRG